MTPEQQIKRAGPLCAGQGAVTKAATGVEQRAASAVAYPRAPIRAAGEIGGARPGRVRNRTKTEPEQKVKKPADSSQKKTPPARKAPSRGRYVDEYARPAV